MRATLRLLVALSRAAKCCKATGSPPAEQVTRRTGPVGGRRWRNGVVLIGLIVPQEFIPEPPKKKVRRPQAQPIRRPVYCSESNDIVGWFRENNPASLLECEELKKAIKKRAKVGRYGADSHEARTGRKLLRVKGLLNNVMIVSRKARCLT